MMRSVGLPVCLSVCRSFYPPWLSVLSFLLSVGLSVCLNVYVCLSVCLSVCLVAVCLWVECGRDKGTIDLNSDVKSSYNFEKTISVPSALPLSTLSSTHLTLMQLLKSFKVSPPICQWIGFSQVV